MFGGPIRVVRMRAKEYGVDPDHLGIVGGSSGGHLALMASLTGDDGKPEAKDPVERISSRVQAVMAWFPPTDMVNWGRRTGIRCSRRPGRPSSPISSAR